MEQQNANLITSLLFKKYKPISKFLKICTYTAFVVTWLRNGKDYQYTNYKVSIKIFTYITNFILLPNNITEFQLRFRIL